MKEWEANNVDRWIGSSCRPALTSTFGSFRPQASIDESFPPPQNLNLRRVYSYTNPTQFFYQNPYLGSSHSLSTLQLTSTLLTPFSLERSAPPTTPRRRLAYPLLPHIPPSLTLTRPMALKNHLFRRLHSSFYYCLGCRMKISSSQTRSTRLSKQLAGASSKGKNLRRGFGLVVACSLRRARPSIGT